MSGPCADCGGPDYQTLEARIAELKAMGTSESARLSHLLITERARIAELEAENEEWIGYFDACYTDMCHYKDRAEQAEAERDALRDRVLRELGQGNLEEGPFGWGMREGGEK